MTSNITDDALYYHEFPTPGKLEIRPTKQMISQQDLALAYSPGVADACEAIAADPSRVSRYTARANLVAVITNGTAVLGLGNIGSLASKPVMEGKAVLFKKFAGVDVFDLEVNEGDVDKFVDLVAALEPTFGGINLEDIKAPECFEIEQRLKARMSIPVFHDDQHGTAICVAAAIRNGLSVMGKSIDEVRLVCSGAGAAALACLNLLVNMGMKHEQITVIDRSGVIRHGREQPFDQYKAPYAQHTDHQSLTEAIVGADIFLGLSGPKVLTQAHVSTMSEQPFILALANPEPEILPELAREVRPRAIIATGRSDYPNQVNNVLCFPFIFRGALDVGATEINEAMKIAAVEAIADIARREASDIVARAYKDVSLTFGPDYLIPKPFDPRLMTEIPLRVAKAAMASGVATRPLIDEDAYRRKLRQFINRSGLVMKPMIERACHQSKRVAFSEGEDERVIYATQALVDEGVCRPLLVGSSRVIKEKIAALTPRLVNSDGFDIIDPQDNPDAEAFAADYHQIMGRRGVSPARAKSLTQHRATIFSSLLLKRGLADALVCGSVGAFMANLNPVKDVIGEQSREIGCAGVSCLVLPHGKLFIADTHVQLDPSAEQIAETAIRAASLMQNFGIVPKVALLSHSNFGSRHTSPSSIKMCKAREILAHKAPYIAVEGEMHGDAALSEAIRQRSFPKSRFTGSANLLICPSLDSANIAYNIAKELADAEVIGPMLVGLKKPVHVVTEAVTVRGLFNIAAVASVDAQRKG